MKGQLLERLTDRRFLTGAEAEALVDRLTSPTTSDAERGAILMGLKVRGDTAGELAHLAVALRRRAVGFHVPASDRTGDRERRRG